MTARQPQPLSPAWVALAVVILAVLMSYWAATSALGDPIFCTGDVVVTCTQGDRTWQQVHP